MRKTFVIAVREYQAAVRTKAFIITLVAMPVLMGGGLISTILLEGQVDVNDKHIAVIDRSGVLFDALETAADTRNEKWVFDTDTHRQTQPRYVLSRVDPGEGELTSEQLAKQCAGIGEGDDKLFALVVIGPNVQEVTERGTADRINIYSNATAFDNFKNWLSWQANEAIRELRFAAAGLPKERIDQCLSHIPVEARKPLELDAATGEVSGGARKNEAADFVIPFIVMMLMFMVITIGAAPLINSVLEEKMQKIAEVLLGSVSPFELMAGKLLGMVGVSATILTVYLGGGVIGVWIAGLGEYIPPNLGALIAWFVIFQAMAVLMFGAMFIAIGAACSDLKEAQSMMMPIWIVVCIPMFVWFNVVREPTSTLSVILSLLPPATPMLMTLRMAASPNIPLWQPLLGVGLVLLLTVFCVFVAGRIFRMGILIQGKGAKLGDMVRWTLRG